MKLFFYHYLKQEQVFDCSNAVNYIYLRCLNLHSSLNIIGVIKSRIKKWVGHVARMGKRRNTCMVLVGNPEDKGPVRRPRNRWENITKDLQDVGRGELTGLIWFRIGTGGRHL
jgi:hypothetical protein